MLALRQKPQAEALDTGHIRAPIGGINAVDAAGAMPEGDCIYAYNVLPGPNGLQVRLGFREWATGLLGITENTIRTSLPFTGSHKNGSTNKFFACTQKGIWAATESGAIVGSPLVTFGTQTGDAGFGVSHVVATPAGRFLLYCDEENGLFVYAEGTDTWTKVQLGTAQPWQSSTTYTSGNKVVNEGAEYVCTVGGVSASSGGPSTTGTGITDGSVTWDYVGPQAFGVIGPSVADQQAGFDGDPASFVFVTVWKSRVWLVEKDSSRGWYLNVNRIFGVATSFDFGSKMRAGGPLVGLYNWSTDDGNGLDTKLVGLSGAGDVVIYGGTDPTSASTFGLVGCWFVGGVPYGRRICTDFGGDVLVLCNLGIMPLSKLITGNPAVDRTQYATYKVGPILSALVALYGTLPGWGLYIHPTQNALLVTLPTPPGQPVLQLVMSFANRGWFFFRDLPIYSAAVWNGQLYFGTTDGRICVNDGYVDNVQLADPNASTPVAYSLLTRSENLGNFNQKQLQFIRPTVLSQTANPTVEATAKYGFDLTEPAPPPDGVASSAGTWDAAKFDEDVWGGDSTPSQVVGGAFGMGRDVAIAIRGTAKSLTTLVGIDVAYSQGGLL